MTTEQPVRYDAQGRMQYHPDYHDRHKQPWTTSEQKYLIENYVADGPIQVAAALGRTASVVAHRACKLRKKGLMPKAVYGQTTRTARGKK